MTKLHLGCGYNHLEGYINIDARKLEGVDEVDDISSLSKYEENSIDLIYVSHVLEHFSRHKYMDVLKRWHHILKPKGVLRIAVPDLEAVFNHYSTYKQAKLLWGFLYGGQTYDENYHYVGFDFKVLSEDLSSIGFMDIKRYDWKDTEPVYFNDFAKSYLPHDSEAIKTGVFTNEHQLMSLNIQCKKI